MRNNTTVIGINICVDYGGEGWYVFKVEKRDLPIDCIYKYIWRLHARNRKSAISGFTQIFISMKYIMIYVDIFGYPNNSSYIQVWKIN